jgi:hypothetical protein
MAHVCSQQRYLRTQHYLVAFDFAMILVSLLYLAVVQCLLHGIFSFQPLLPRNSFNVIRYPFFRRSRTSSALFIETPEDQGESEPTRIYLEIGLGSDGSVGRLVFNLKDSERLLPLHAENFIKLCTGEMRSLDPRLGYVNCAFKHSPQFVEGFPQYRWAHTLDGKGRNAVGRPTERISDPENLRACTNSVYGGVYHGIQYDTELVGDYGVMLTVPLVGAYRGSSGFSIVRVGESPQEWGERLLLNSAVLGYLESGIEVLHRIARQTDAPPTILASGKL